MTADCTVSPFTPLTLDDLEYDLYMAANGYEQRARFVSECRVPNARRRIACAFPDRHVLAFDENAAWYRSNAFAYQEVDQANFIGWFSRILTECRQNTEEARPLRVCIDISSLTRRRIAAVVAGVMDVAGDVDVHADFVYALAQYSPPSRENEPIESAGAVLPEFAGWSSDPTSPSVMIVGLGYEPDKAVGAYEYLEASRVWAFMPTGGDERYERAVRRANRTLLRELESPELIEYRVDQPYRTFVTLESLSYGAMSVGRPVLMPFGPKIFALCALLVGSVHQDIGVWRISSGQYGTPLDRVADGTVVGLRTRFTSSLACSEEDVEAISVV